MKVGIITDIHENLIAFKEALKLAEIHKCNELACLGDIVGYDRRFYKYDGARSAKECLRLVRSSCRWIVTGNHDLFAANRFPLYSNGFVYPENWFSLNANERKTLSKGKVWCFEGDIPNDLDVDDKLFLKSLPEYIVTSEPAVTCAFSHYFCPDFTGSTTKYVERKNHLKEQWEFMETNKILFSFSGHSHNHFAGFAYRDTGSFLKAIHTFPDKTFNLGNEMIVVLLPPLSGEKGRTGFSIVDTSNLTLSIIYTGLS